MKYLIPVFCLMFAVSCTESVSTSEGDSLAHDTSQIIAPVEAGPIGGVYSFGSNPETEAVGSIIVFPESDTTILFYLDFTRGAPSYNVGQLAARAYKRNDVWLFSQAEPDQIDGCEIEFMFNEKFLQLVTRQMNCGFGANVIVDHVYNRTSTLVPAYFIGPEGDTVYFSNLAKAVK